MVKDADTVIRYGEATLHSASLALSSHTTDRVCSEFNELVNIEDWLGSDASARSGWSKDDGSSETVSHERYWLRLVANVLKWRC